jgi:hypothetical protein
MMHDLRGTEQGRKTVRGYEKGEVVGVAHQINERWKEKKKEGRKQNLCSVRCHNRYGIKKTVQI